MQRISSQSSDKCFDVFYFENTGLEEIPENVFGDLKFERVSLSGGFSYIHPNAFSSSAPYVKHFSIASENYPSKDRELFDIINTFSNMTYLTLLHSKFNAIPDRAFSENLSKLSTIFWQLSKSLSTIGSYAFYELPNLTSLTLVSSKISKIKRFAFAFRKPSNIPLKIELVGNPIDDSSFEINSLMFTNRPIHLTFEAYGYRTAITSLNENVFAPFLLSNENNKIYFNNTRYYAKKFVCDCKMKWLIADELIFLEQVYGIWCKDGRQIWDYSLSEFAHCPETKKKYKKTI
jgi:Leucine-rich repeat (LRR) protein